MDEYIERESAIASLTEFRDDQTVSKYLSVDHCLVARDVIERAIKVLESLPTADVEPVKRGRWVHNDEYVLWAEKYVCSVCGRNALSDGGYRHELSSYCPNCGAKMDG